MRIATVVALFHLPVNLFMVRFWLHPSLLPWGSGMPGHLIDR